MLTHASNLAGIVAPWSLTYTSCQLISSFGVVLPLVAPTLPPHYIPLPIAILVNSRANQTNMGFKESPKRAQSLSPGASQLVAFSLMSKSVYRPPLRYSTHNP